MRTRLSIIGLVLVLAFAAVVPWSDGEHAPDAVHSRYGMDVFEKTQRTPCATDGVGIGRVPFGFLVTHCSTRWFVPLGSRFYAFAIR